MGRYRFLPRVLDFPREGTMTSAISLKARAGSLSSLARVRNREDRFPPLSSWLAAYRASTGTPRARTEAHLMDRFSDQPASQLHSDLVVNLAHLSP